MLTCYVDVAIEFEGHVGILTFTDSMACATGSAAELPHSVRMHGGTCARKDKHNVMICAGSALSCIPNDSHAEICISDCLERLHSTKASVLMHITSSFQQHHAFCKG